MLGILLELVLCLAVGGAVAWFATSATNAFLIVAVAVACSLGFFIYLVRHGGWGALLSFFAGI